MKRKVLFVTFLVLLVLTLSVSAWGTSTEQAAFFVGENYYTVETDMMYSMDTVPFIENDCIFVPARYFARAAGIPDSGIIWNAADRVVTIQKDGFTVSFGIGEHILYVNAEPRAISAAAVLRENRAFLPVRAIAEALGYKVTWDPEQRAVRVYAQGGGENEMIVEKVKKDLAEKKGLPLDQITVKKVESVSWPDTSLGCPEPGKMYAQVITPGCRVVLSGGGKDYVYHTGLNGTFVLCENN